MEAWFARLRVPIQAIRIIEIYMLRLDILKLKLSNNISTSVCLDYLLSRSKTSHVACWS